MFAPTDKMFSCRPRPMMIMERKQKSNVELAPNCPRCASSNTKFCYYNNYSLSQPRFFCKGCRRYWTKGGSLRKVPVGGGYRKNRRGKSAAPNERVSMAYSDIPSSSDNPLDDHKSCAASNGNSVINDTSADIDLVFAKFLNQNSWEPELVTAPGLPNVIEDSFFDISKNYSNPSSDGSHPIHENLQDQTNMFAELNPERRTTPQFMCPEANSYGFEAQLSEEIGPDGLWSGSNFTWKPPQLEEFESEILFDDRLVINPNLITENWISF